MLSVVFYTTVVHIFYNFSYNLEIILFPGQNILPESVQEYLLSFKQGFFLFSYVGLSCNRCDDMTQDPPE